LPPVNVLDPVTCAALAMERSRLHDPANQQLTKAKNAVANPLPGLF
jgi:hypothetical protein